MIWSQHHAGLRRLRIVAGTGAAAVVASVLLILLSSAGSQAAAPPVDVFPIPGAQVAAPSSQIAFRGVSLGQLGSIVVTGSSSGVHTGRVLGDSDGRGGSFLPDEPFKPGERVTVKTGLNTVGARTGSFSFTVASPAGRVRAAATKATKRVKGDVWRFASRPDLAPAAVRVTKLPSRAAASGDLCSSDLRRDRARTVPSCSAPTVG